MKSAQMLYVAQMRLRENHTLEIVATSAADRAAAVSTVEPARIIQLEQFDGMADAIADQLPQRVVTPPHDEESDSCGCGQCTATRLNEMLVELFAGDQRTSKTKH